MLIHQNIHRTTIQLLNMNAIKASIKLFQTLFNCHKEDTKHPPKCTIVQNTTKTFKVLKLQYTETLYLVM